MAGPAKVPPRWLIWLNIAALRLGIPIGSQWVLTIVGRSTGRLRHTPASIVTVGPDRYIVAALSEAEWVKNARAAGVGCLTRGRTQSQVRLVELPIGERPPVPRAFLKQVPGGVRFFGVSPDPDVIAAAAAQYPVFRLDPAS
ncbi:MAG: deazaflavin-dependent nitroreductase [Candidatus Limnocylindrales bacterium]